jgi:anti-anti-sigma factor
MDIAIDVSSDASGRSVLVVAGAIDLQTRESLATAGRTALQNGAPALVLDLGGVTFIDSTGIGTLVELGHDAEDAEAQLVIRRPSARVQRILEMTGLDDAWAVESG